MLRAIFRRPYRPVAQTIYYAVAATLGAVLLIVGQSWAIGFFAAGCGGVLLMGAGAAWRRRHPN
jgi:hypothetical protein